MNQVIRVSRGEVIGIGKVKIPRTINFDHEIQLLSFISIREDANSFISTCIHLHIDGYGKTEEEADENMVENICYFLTQNFKVLSNEDAWENIRELFKSDAWSSELWDAYREVQVQLSIRGEQTDGTAELAYRLDQLEKKRSEEWESWVRESMIAEKRIKELETQADKLKEFVSKYVIADFIVKRMRLNGGA